MISYEERTIRVNTAEELDVIVKNLISMGFGVNRFNGDETDLDFKIGVSHDPYDERTHYWVLLDRSAVKRLRKERNYKDLLKVLTKTEKE